MMGKTPLAKYDYPRNPTVTIYIRYIDIPNVLVDLAATIKVMTIEAMKKLVLANLRPTPIVLELADRSTIKPVIFLDDLVVSVDSWK